MATAIAQRDAGKTDPAWPDRPKHQQQRTQNLRRRKFAATGRPVIVDVAEPRRCAEQTWRGGAHLSRPVQQRGTSLDPEKLVSRIVLERTGEARRGEPRQCLGISTPGLGRIGGEKA